MIVTSPPKKNIDKKKLDYLISKGGSSTNKKNMDSAAKICQIGLRIPEGLINAIDEAIKGKYGGKTQSRNSFIIQSIEKALGDK